MACYPEQVIAVASAEEGYLEKKSNAMLDNKTANAGYNNFCRYWRDTYPAFQGQPWCDDFVKWCFITTYGKEKANELLCGGVDSYYTPTSARYFQKAGRLDKNPKAGDQIFFSTDGTIDSIHHTGIVLKTDRNYVYTIEGNTSVTSGVIPNGGGVWRKKYLLVNYIKRMWFGHPLYDEKKAMIPYIATANVKTYLQVRTGPGTNNPEFRVSNGNGTWTSWRIPPAAQVVICEEKNGWGRIGNTVGWVSLSYLKK